MTSKYLQNNKAYLKSIFKVLPTNAYINKLLPNTGATTLEIESHRHSIIIEPNVPVIVGKELQFKDKNIPIKGVYEGVTFDSILEYLHSDLPYKKIITTPESYPKVKSAILHARFDLYTDFFILLDECEKVIQDCVYRKKIILPFEDFFKFQGKAMISATPLPPSDPRFRKFNQYQIKTKFKYRKPLKLVTTNSVLLSLRKYITNHPDEHYFVFLNSTQVIASLITALDIKEESNVFCSRESVLELKINDLPDSYETLPLNGEVNGPFKKYNFFTSRFFSAVDIILTYKPTVIMLTEVNHAFHSILDPKTESVQILGRFRRKIKQAVHITNIDYQRTPKTEGEANAYLEGCESSYLELKRLHKSATNEGATSTLKEALVRVEYAQYVNEDGSKNHFMWDYFINESRVMAYYTNVDRLSAGYQSSKHFKLDIDHEKYPNIDIVLNPLTKQLSAKKTFQTVCDALQEVFYNSEKYSSETIQYFYQQIDRSFPEEFNFFNQLGYMKLSELGFSKFKARNAIYGLKSSSERGNFQLLNKLKLEFQEGCCYPGQIIVNVLRSMLSELELSLKPEIKLLKEYFEIARTTMERDSNKKDVKGYRILRRKFS